MDDGSLSKRITVTDFISKGIPKISTTTSVEKTNSLPLDDGALSKRATVFDFLTKGIPFLDNTTTLDRTNKLPVDQGGSEKNISVFDFLSKGIPFLDNTTNISKNDSLPLNQSGTEKNANVVDFLTQTIPQLSSTTTVDKNDFVTLSKDLTASNITVLDFLSKALPQLDTAIPLLSSDLVPVGQDINTFSRNTTIDKVNTYVHTHAPQISQCFYVGKHGVDADDFEERGKNVQLPYASIKYAAMKVAKAKVNDTYPKQYTIFVATGIYNEDNPIYLPPNTSLIGDNLRRTSITPWHETYDVLWVNSGCYIWGFTFGDHTNNHTHPSAAVAFPLNIQNCKKSDRFRTGFDNTSSFNIAFNNNYTGTMVLSSRPYISLSPYTQGCTSYANSSNMEDINVNDAGCGIRVDGSLVDGPIRSMVMDSFTQVNQGGIGVHVINHGYASLVSIFTICTTEGVLCEDGGSCSISTSNSTFGLSGLVARGKSLYPILTGRLKDFKYLDNYLTIGDIGTSTPIEYSVIPQTNQIDLSLGNFSKIILDKNNAPLTTPNGTLIDSSYRNASNTILSNKTLLQQQVVDWAITNYYSAMSNSPTLTSKCFRDTGYIVDAIAADISNNANHRSIEVGNMYYAGVLKTLNVTEGNPVIPSEQVEATVNSITQLGVFINNLINTVELGSSRRSDVTSRVSDIVYPLNNNGSLKDYQHVFNGQTLNSGTPSAKDIEIANIISSNRTRLQDEVSAYVQAKSYLSNAALISICRRDAGLMVDAVVHDLTTGVMARSIQYALAYWDGSSTRLPDSLVPNHKSKTIDTINFLNTSIKKILSENEYISEITENKQIIATYPYSGLCFTIGDNEGESPFLVGDYPTAQTPVDADAIKNWFITQTPVTLDNQNCTILLDQNLPLNFYNVNGKNFLNATVKFYLRSQAATGSHTFEYIGTGTRILSSIPSRFGVAINDNEVVYDGLYDANQPGVVYYTSTNELGNFDVGPEFRIVQSTGTIRGRTFDRSILTLVTPLNIALE